MTARPARVRMRSRKPWTFARRRLFGWNVRLLTGAPDAVLISNGYGRLPCAATQGQPVNGKGDARTGQTGPGWPQPAPRSRSTIVNTAVWRARPAPAT